MDINLNAEARECAQQIGLALCAGTIGNGLEGYIEKLVDMSPLSFIAYLDKRGAWMYPNRVPFSAILRFHQALVEREREYSRNDLG